MKRGPFAVTMLCGAALTACGGSSASVVPSPSAVPSPPVVSPTTPVTFAMSPPATARAGVPAAFPYTLGIPQGDAIRTMTVNWGDGTTSVLPFTTPASGKETFTGTLSHIFSATGSYGVSVTIVDTAGDTLSISTGVTVG
jgi:hypothetical protein